MLPPPSARELQDVVYDAAARIGIALALGRLDEAAGLGEEIARCRAGSATRATVALAVEALVAGGRLDRAEAILAARAVDASSGARRGRGARIALARGRGAGGRLAEAGVERRDADGARALDAPRAAAARGGARRERRSPSVPRDVLQRARRRGDRGAARCGVARAAAVLGQRLGLDVPLRRAGRTRRRAGAAAARRAAGDEPLRRRPRLHRADPGARRPRERAEHLAALHRLAVTEVGRRHGIVDKFAGDAVMATFNATGARLDHTELAAEAALALRDKAALLDIPIGIGIAVGPAVVGRAVAGDERERPRLDDEPRRAPPGGGGDGRDRARRGGPPAARRRGSPSAASPRSRTCSS